MSCEPGLAATLAHDWEGTPGGRSAAVGGNGLLHVWEAPAVDHRPELRQGPRLAHATQRRHAGWHPVQHSKRGASGLGVNVPLQPTPDSIEQISAGEHEIHNAEDHEGAWCGK